MVEPGEGAALVLRVDPAVVPVGNHDLAVRVEAGHHEEDDVVQDALRLLVVLRQQVVGELWSHLCASDLCGVEAHGLADHGLAPPDELLDLLLFQALRVGEPVVILPDFLKVTKVLCG